MLRRMKKISAALLIVMMLVTVFGNTAASAEDAAPAQDTNPYVFVHDAATPYWHRSPHRINNGTTPAMYQLVSGNLSLPVYCCDIETSIKPGTAYKRINLEDAGYYTADSAAHIRFILANGFWAGRDNLSSLEASAGVTGLTAAEALTATQAAIWANANVQSISDVYWGTSAVSTSGIRDTSAVNPAESASEESDARITAVYNYLCQGTMQNTSTVAGFTGQQVVLTIASSLDTYDVTIKFGLKGTFYDAGSLKLNAELKNGAGTVASAEYDLLGAGALTADGDGLYSVTFKDIAAQDLAGADISLKINGSQYVQDGIYFYEPQGGRSTAQCFVGYGAGETPIYAESSTAVEVGQQSLSLQKVDGSILAEGEAVPMEGVEFDLYVQIGDNPAVKYPGLETARTDSSGNLSWSGLVEAANVTYYYKENVPAGYHTVDAAGNKVNAMGLLDSTVPVLVQNCHDLGNLSITKQTPNLPADSVNAERSYSFKLTLDYNRAQLLQNSHEWPTVEVLEQEYADLDEVVLEKESTGIMSAVISLKAGETISLEGIPAGAVYTITELDADGKAMEDGKLYGFDGELMKADSAVKSGNIPAADGASVRIVYNNYVYGKAQWDLNDVIEAQKNLDGKPSAQAFKFTLTDVTDPAVRRTVETVTNGTEGDTLGLIDFAPIVYTEAGTYIYEIHEELTSGYICDDKVYTVEVTVERNDNTKNLEVKETKVTLPGEPPAAEPPAAEPPAVAEPAVNPTPPAQIVLPEPVVQSEIVFENETIYYDYDYDYTSLAVRKVWKLDDGGTAADAVTVNLLKNGKVEESVILSAANGWSKAWYTLDDDYKWSVEEASVPEGFTSSISKSGLTWTIINDDITREEPEKEEPKQEDPKKEEPGDGGSSEGGNGGNEGPGGSGEELVELEEGDVPLADVPKTGNSMIPEIICIVSGLILTAVLLTGKKRTN